MIHFVLFSHPKIGRTYAVVECPMPKEGYSNPETYGLDADVKIEAVIHNVPLMCSFTIVNELETKDAKPQQSPRVDHGQVDFDR